MPRGFEVLFIDILEDEAEKTGRKSQTNH